MLNEDSSYFRPHMPTILVGGIFISFAHFIQGVSEPWGGRAVFASKEAGEAAASNGFFLAALAIHGNAHSHAPRTESSIFTFC